MKPWGKKNTGKGNAAGSPPVSHVRMKATRKIRSFTQDARDFRVAKDTFSQIGGNCKNGGGEEEEDEISIYIRTISEHELKK
jgi:hypothetical protein